MDQVLAMLANPLMTFWHLPPGERAYIYMFYSSATPLGYPPGYLQPTILAGREYPDEEAARYLGGVYEPGRFIPARARGQQQVRRQDLAGSNSAGLGRLSGAGRLALGLP
jgi:hypothetical protein